MSIISFSNVNKWYGNFQVLKDISFTVGEGEVIVLVGPSGSGKSTLLRCINGLEEVDSGEVIVRGVPIHQRGANLTAVRAEIGFVFQQFNLYPHKTAEENITLAPVHLGRMSKKQAQERSQQLLRRVGIPEQSDKRPRALSGGQQQRVAIARSLAMDPKIMLFDEPTSALDPEMIKEVLEVMTDLVHDGMTMLVVTHELNFARKVADRIVFMDDGAIVDSAPPEEFFDSPKSERTKKFLDQILTV